MLCYPVYHALPRREHTFLANENVPPTLRDNKVTVTVAAKGEALVAHSAPGTLQVAYVD